MQKKIVLITGGSRGIGAATAIAAAREGWHVVLTYHASSEAARSVVTQIEKEGGSAEAIDSDVGDANAVAQLFATLRERYGRLDGLVNNAGILPHISRLEDIALERWERTFGINVTGTFLCCQQAIRLMASRHGGKGGAIVNLSSMASVFGGAGEFIDYGASKAAVEAMTVGLARELGSDGIRVNGVRPGLIATDIHGSAGDAGRVDRLAASVPLGRPGTPQETAAAIVWLLSDAASYVTGTMLAVSGGR